LTTLNSTSAYEFYEPYILLRPEAIEDFCERLLIGAGVPDAKARLVAESLVAGSLRGVDSHGVQLLAFYLEKLAKGDMDPHADGRVVSESGACLLYDGQNALGQVVSAICCDHAIRLARELGAGVVIARESNHFGAAAFWTQRISAHGLIGIALTNASPLVPPWQGKETRIGTNPICMSVPAADGKGWLLDMATTTVAAGKIFRAALSGNETIPEGWAMDREGVPTTDTDTALKGLLMPLGGYKGSGLGMLVEILCGVLGGGAMSTELAGVRNIGVRMRTSHLFLAIDVARFMPLDEFHARLGRLVTGVKSAPPASGFGEVLVAGDPEWRSEEIRRRDGVPVTVAVWDRLVEAAGRMKIGVPDFVKGQS